MYLIFLYQKAKNSLSSIGNTMAIDELSVQKASIHGIFLVLLEYSMASIHREDTVLLLSLQWRHNGRDSVSNHQPHHCLLNRLFRRGSKKTSKLRVTGLCVGNSPGPGPVNSPHKWPVTRKMFPFDDVIMRCKQPASIVFSWFSWNTQWPPFTKKTPSYFTIIPYLQGPKYPHKNSR